MCNLNFLETILEFHVQFDLHISSNHLKLHVQLINHFLFVYRFTCFCLFILLLVILSFNLECCPCIRFSISSSNVSLYMQWQIIHLMMIFQVPAAVSIQEPMLCAGCGEQVCDRFFLLAAGRVWHGACLRCSQCQCELQTQPSLFWRDGNIYCQQDYCRSPHWNSSLVSVVRSVSDVWFSWKAFWRRSVCSLLPANPTHRFGHEVWWADLPSSLLLLPGTFKKLFSCHYFYNIE